MSLSKVRVAVLRGGPTHDYNLSLKSGGQVLALLREHQDSYVPIDIFISKDGEWYANGITHEPHKALKHVDVVWNALPGWYGEAGQIQRLLDSVNKPYVGSSAVASALSLNKDMTKRLYDLHSIPMPKHELITIENFNHDLLINIFRTYLHPVVVKPTDGSSSMGVRRVHSYLDLEEAVRSALEESPKVLVEEFVLGREASCSVVENARGEKLYALVPVEVHSSGHRCPGSFSVDEHKRIEHLAKKAHEILGLRHYSRSDFVITTSGKIYILETNTVPTLSEECHLPKSLTAVGWKPKDFVDHMVRLALAKVE